MCTPYVDCTAPSHRPVLNGVYCCVVQDNQRAIQDKGTFLKAVDVLSSLSDKQRSDLAAEMLEIVYADSEPLFQKGDSSDCLYLVKASSKRSK